jgi:IstB-like ATP binding protein
VFLGPPGTGKTHLATGIAIRARQAGHRVLFATASQWVDRLAAAHASGKLQAELARLARYPLLVIDEVGYIPFEPEAANLFFQLVSGRYERASLIVTSNKPFAKAHMFARTCVRRRRNLMGSRLPSGDLAALQHSSGRLTESLIVGIGELGQSLFSLGPGGLAECVDCFPGQRPALVEVEVGGDPAGRVDERRDGSWRVQVAQRCHDVLVPMVPVRGGQLQQRFKVLPGEPVGEADDESRLHVGPVMPLDSVSQQLQTERRSVSGPELAQDFLG